MTRVYAAAAVALSTMALAACGGSAKGTPLGGGSQGAAQAMYQAAQPLVEAGTPPSSGGSVVVKGAHGGTATLTYTQSTSAGPNNVYVTIAYDNFNWDGVDTYNGTLAAGTHFLTGSMQVDFEGSLDISGAVSDSLAITVTQTISSATGTTTLNLSGNIATTTVQYNYSNQNFSFSGADALPKS